MIGKAARVVTFACRWTIGEDTGEVGGSKLIPVICSGRVTPGYVLQAFEWGADGVMVAGCGPEKCKYMFGARQQEGQFAIVREVCQLLGIGEERLKLAWVNSAEELEQVAAEFTAQVSALPPLDIEVVSPEPVPGPPMEVLRAASRSYACIDCGKCTGFCPVSRHTKGYSPHRIVLRSVFEEQPEAKIAEAVWGCYTCGLCERRCMAAVKYSTLQQGLRQRARAAGDTGRCTHSGALLSIMRLHAAGGPTQDRLGWIPEDARTSEEGKTALFVGCAPYFDKVFEHMNVKTTDATRGALALLNAMGVEPVVMKDEVCCGHDLLWSGDRATFEKLAKKNVENLVARGVETVVFPCAECYRTATKDWAEVCGALPFKTTHIAEMVAGSKLKLSGDAKKVTIQDACRLSRHMEKPEAVRGALAKDSGIEVREMMRHGIKADCCGSSSWVNCSAGTAALQETRLGEARATGAEALITACPKCEIHLACSQTSKDEKIEIVNVASVLAEALDTAPAKAPVKAEAD